MSRMTSSTNANQKGFLAWVERTGNALPDPVFLFVYLILAIIIISALSAAFGVSETLSPQILSGMPDAQKARFGIGDDGTIMAQSMLSASNLQRLLVEMPKTFTHFHPLGMVLTVMLGAGVAERTGLFGTAMRAAVGNAPKYLLTPLVAFIAMMGNLAADAAYVVLIPLAALVFVAANRNPIAGIAAAFAGVSGGFSANLVMGQLDALLLGITGEAANILVADYPVNIAGNWYFIATMLFIYVPVIWYVTDKVVEPRLGPWDSESANVDSSNSEVRQSLSADEKRGLKRAGLALLGIVACIDLWPRYSVNKRGRLPRCTTRGGRLFVSGSPDSVLSISDRWIFLSIYRNGMGLRRRRWNGEKPSRHCQNDVRSHERYGLLLGVGICRRPFCRYV